MGDIFMKLFIIKGVSLYYKVYMRVRVNIILVKNRVWKIKDEARGVKNGKKLLLL